MIFCQVGKGLAKDAKAQKLAFQHWIEAVRLYYTISSQSSAWIFYLYHFCNLYIMHLVVQIDPRHRYGHNLNLYYEEWRKRDTVQPFFYWYFSLCYELYFSYVKIIIRSLQFHHEIPLQSFWILS